MKKLSILLTIGLVSKSILAAPPSMELTPVDTATKQPTVIIPQTEAQPTPQAEKKYQYSMSPISDDYTNFKIKRFHLLTFRSKRDITEIFSKTNPLERLQNTQSSLQYATLENGNLNFSSAVNNYGESILRTERALLSPEVLQAIINTNSCDFQKNIGCLVLHRQIKNFALIVSLMNQQIRTLNVIAPSGVSAFPRKAKLVNQIRKRQKDADVVVFTFNN